MNKMCFLLGPSSGGRRIIGVSTLPSGAPHIALRPPDLLLAAHPRCTLYTTIEHRPNPQILDSYFTKLSENNFLYLPHFNNSLFFVILQINWFKIEFISLLFHALFTSIAKSADSSPKKRSRKGRESEMPRRCKVWKDGGWWFEITSMHWSSMAMWQESRLNGGQIFKSKI